MKLWLISQSENSDYDSYDSAIVAAMTEEEARNMDPAGGILTKERWEESYGSWCSSPENVRVEYIGKADKGVKEGVVLASFNAG